MTSYPPLLHAAPLLLLLLFATPAAAASDEATQTTIDLSAEASRPAANDLARATVFAEVSGTTPSELANRVNSLISDGLKTAKTYSNVKTQSGATHSYPIYGKGNKIEGWRMRSELTLESQRHRCTVRTSGQAPGLAGRRQPDHAAEPGNRRKSRKRGHASTPSPPSKRAPRHRRRAGQSLPDQASVDQQQRPATVADHACGSPGFGRCRTDADRGRRYPDQRQHLRADRASGVTAAKRATRIAAS
jgi:hypothetical protein